MPIGAMDVRMKFQFNMLMCRERYESSTTTSLRSTRAIDTRPVEKCRFWNSTTTAEDKKSKSV